MTVWGVYWTMGGTIAALLVGLLIVGFRVGEVRREGEAAVLRAIQDADVRIRCITDQRDRVERRMAGILESWAEDQDRMRGFDEVLATLPHGPPDGPDYHRIRSYDAPRYLATMAAMDPVPDAVFYASIDFERVPFGLNGRRLVGWRRGDWLLVPEEIARPQERHQQAPLAFQSKKRCNP